MLHDLVMLMLKICKFIRHNSSHRQYCHRVWRLSSSILQLWWILYLSCIAFYEFDISSDLPRWFFGCIVFVTLWNFLRLSSHCSEEYMRQTEKWMNAAQCILHFSIFVCIERVTETTRRLITFHHLSSAGTHNLITLLFVYGTLIFNLVLDLLLHFILGEFICHWCMTVCGN